MSSSSIDFGSSIEFNSKSDDWMLSSDSGIVFTDKDFNNVPKSKNIRNLFIIGIATVVLIVLVILASEILLSENAGKNDTVVIPENRYEKFASVTLAMMNVEADPCEDFYEFVCGGWMDEVEIPADKSRITASFDGVTDENEKKVEAILNDEMDSKIHTIWTNCLDLDRLDSIGLDRLIPIFDLIDALDSSNIYNELATVLVEAEKFGVGLLFDLFFETDFFDNTQQTLFLHQVSLMLGSRDIYMQDTEENLKTRSDFTEHLERALILLGYHESDAVRISQKILNLEIEIAGISADNLYFRNPYAMYNSITQPELSTMANMISWESYFYRRDIGGIGEERDIHVTYIPYFQNFTRVIQQIDEFDVVQAYFKYKIFESMSSYLPTNVQDEFFTLEQIKTGSLEKKARHKECIAIINNYFGEILGKLFVDKYFPPTSKDKALEMIHDLEEAFEDNIDQSVWMDDSAKVAAKEKLMFISNKIGYPDHWRDFTPLDIQAGELLGNIQASIAYEFQYQLDQFKDETDKSAWGMYPHQVNAYYNPIMNEIAFPAGILQEPFFNPEYPSAKNYGGIGSVVGHELTHAFDDEGSQFDKDGKLHDWWNAETRAQFTEKAQCIIDQYDEYVIDGMNVNGRLTEGENIADNGGVKEAFNAFMKNNKDDEALVTKAYGYSSKQLFFITYGQVWCSKYRHEYLKGLIETNPHSPGNFRTIGPLQNYDEFHETFQCKNGDKMVRENKCNVW